MKGWWLIITHIFSMFPICVSMMSFKYRKDWESLFYCIFFIFNVAFSILYHTYHVPSIDKIEGGNLSYMDNQQYIWTYLDSKYSSWNMLITSLYTFRIRPPYFWVLVMFGGTIGEIILLQGSHPHVFNRWWLVCSCGSVVAFQYRTVIHFFKKQLKLTIAGIFFGFGALGWFLAAQPYWYGQEPGETFHALWHAFIFTTAGCGSLLRYRLNSELYPIADEERERLESL